MELTMVAGAAGFALLLLVALVIAGSTVPPPTETSGRVIDESEYKAVVIFRNDDLEPGHRDDLRHAVDSIFLDEQVPVTNAVIPVPDGESIAANESFCQHLRNRQRQHPRLVEYTLHGYRHESTTDHFDGDSPAVSGVTSEFGGLPLPDQLDRIEKGKGAFAKCLGDPPRSFVPPFGTYDESTVRALSEADIHVVSGGSWFTSTYFGETEPFDTGGVLHVPRHHGFVDDWDTVSFHDRHTLRERFDTAYENEGVYVHVLHYWTFDTADRRDTLSSFLTYVKAHDGVLFLTLGEFADAYRDGRLHRADHGWRYVPPANPTIDISSTTPHHSLHSGVTDPTCPPGADRIDPAVTSGSDRLMK